MDFKKAKIAIQTIGGIEYKNGSVDLSNTYGFYNIKKKSSRSSNYNSWKFVAVDLASGLRICDAKTRKECAAWLENKDNIKLVEYQRSKPEYSQYVRKMKEFKGEI